MEPGALVEINNRSPRDLCVPSNKHPSCLSDTSPFAKCFHARRTWSPRSPAPVGRVHGRCPRDGDREEPPQAQNPGQGPPNPASVPASSVVKVPQVFLSP